MDRRLKEKADSQKAEITDQDLQGKGRFCHYSAVKEKRAFL
jgi:hypothetical protein